MEGVNAEELSVREKKGVLGDLYRERERERNEGMKEACAQM